MDIGKQKRVIQVEPEPLIAPAEAPTETAPVEMPSVPESAPLEQPVPAPGSPD